jgi:hypothetical protein
MLKLEVYFDDSGTDGTSPVAVAACYISSKEQWDHFVRNWDEVRKDEGFDVFHMTEFMAKKEAGHKPYCDWNTTKKDRVYRKLASIINTRIRRGFGIAIPKAPFDKYAIQEFKDEFASDHYTWAVRSALLFISSWREQHRYVTPMQYVFHRGSLSQPRIQEIWESESKKNNALAELRFGMVPEGIMFQDAAVFKPLQAADILAWQVHNQMRRTVMMGIPMKKVKVHDNARMTLGNPLVCAAYYGSEQTKKVFDDARLYKASRGDWPWKLGPFRDSVKLGKAGTVDER